MFPTYFSYTFSVFIDILLFYMLFTLVFPKGFPCGKRQRRDETGDADSGDDGEGGLMAAARPHPLNILSWSPQKRYRVMSVLALAISNILHLVKNVIYFLRDFKASTFLYPLLSRLAYPSIFFLLYFRKLSYYGVIFLGGRYWDSFTKVSFASSLCFTHIA
jgi:hypothetical protein